MEEDLVNTGIDLERFGRRVSKTLDFRRLDDYNTCGVSLLRTSLQ